MAFNGYYLKINGTAYPTAYMVIPTYHVNDMPIVVSDVYTADYSRKIKKAPKLDLTITFNLRQLFNNEYVSAVAPFQDTMTIEYYDPKIDGYLTDTFTYNCDLTPQILRQINTTLVYNEVPITLVRKAAE